MKEKYIMVGDDKVILTEVANDETGRLYQFPLDGRICGAPIREVRKRFPWFNMGPYDAALYEYLIEENGTLQLYDEEGNQIDGFELITEEEINKI